MKKAVAPLAGCLVVAVIAITLVLRNKPSSKKETAFEEAVTMLADVYEVSTPELDADYIDSVYVEVMEQIDLSSELEPVAASRSMYLAHSILRADEVGNPESTINLETRAKLLEGVLSLAEQHQAILKQESIQ